MANLTLMQIARQIVNGIRSPVCGCEEPCSPRDVEIGKYKAEELARRKESDRLLMKRILGERNMTDRYGLTSSSIGE